MVIMQIIKTVLDIIKTVLNNSLMGLTLEEEIYERPCIVDDSKNSRKISIFTDGTPFIGGRKCNVRCLVISTLCGSS